MSRSYALGGRESRGCSAGRRCGFPHPLRWETADEFGGLPGSRQLAHALHWQRTSDEESPRIIASMAAHQQTEQADWKGLSQSVLPTDPQRRKLSDVTSILDLT